MITMLGGNKDKAIEIKTIGIHALGYNITLLAGQFEGSYVLILHCPKPRISARHLQRGAGDVIRLFLCLKITEDSELVERFQNV